MLKKPLLIIGGISLFVILILPLLFGAVTHRDYLAAIAFLSFGVSLLLLFIGFILLLVSIGAKEVLPYGQASFIVGGLILLLSFTLCTTGGAMMNL